MGWLGWVGVGAGVLVLLAIIGYFIEKKEMKSGLINGGIYLLNKNILDIIDLKKFSFELDFMEKNKDYISIYSFNSNCYFIDIGIEEDYKVAQQANIFKKGIV